MEYLIIQIQEQQVLAARFGFGGRSATLAGAASFELGNGQELAAVADRIAEGSSGSPRVVLCLPPALFAQRSVDLPLKELRKVREVLPAHLQGEMALQPEEAVFDALPSADGSFLALWARRSDIAQAITVFREAGIEPQIVSAVPFGWSRLPGISGSCLVSDGTALAVFRDGKPLFMRAFGSGNPQQQLSATLTALEMSDQVLPSQLIVFGQQADQLAAVEVQPLAGERLDVRRLELPAELAPLFRTDQAFQQLAGLYAVAQACHGGVLPDFRRGELAWTADDAKQRKKLLLTAALGALAVLLLFVYKGYQYRQAKADLASLNGSIAAIYREIFPNRPKAVDELAEIRGEIKKLSTTSGSAGVLDLLKQLAEAKRDSINGLYEAELDGRSLRVKGDARSAQAANEFKAALAPLMTTVELGEVKSRPDGTVSFTLAGTLKEVKR